MFIVYRGHYKNCKRFDQKFAAEFYAETMSDEYPKANIYLAKEYGKNMVVIAKYRGGYRVNGVLNDMFGF